MNAGNVPAGSTPRSRTSPLVNGDTVRTTSARLTAAAASRSPRPESTRRAGDPYSRVDVRQSAWTSRTILARLRASRRASRAAAASYAVCATTASGRCARSARAVRHGSSSQKRGPSSGRRGTRVKVPFSAIAEPGAALARTCTSSSRASASNLRAADGGSGSR